MRRVVAAVVVLACVLGGYTLTVYGWSHWFLGFGLIAGAVLGWLIGQCPHSGPCSLLPATSYMDGTRLPARWVCGECGTEWPANLDRPQTPVQKFTGYDPSKAVASAARAKDLHAKQRTLAQQRAGCASAILTPASEFERRKAAK